MPRFIDRIPSPPDEVDTPEEYEAYYRDSENYLDEHEPDESEY